MIKYLKNKSKQAYNIGYIDNLDTYIDEEYGSTYDLFDYKLIDLKKYRNRELEKGVGNCTLVSIVRVLEYLRDQGYSNIPIDKEDIYRDIKKIAKKNFYTDKYGTLPIMAANIYESILMKYNYNAYSRGIFLWDFNDNIKREIDFGYPLIFNIARGYYKNHSVVIAGYAIYKADDKKKKINILLIHDGWRKELRFLDFNQFQKNLLFAGLGSFNNLRIL